MNLASSEGILSKKYAGIHMIQWSHVDSFFPHSADFGFVDSEKLIGSQWIVAQKTSFVAQIVRA
jgi:hypothetical protein